MPFAVPWIDLQGIMLSEMLGRKTDTAYYHLHTKSKKINKYNKIGEKRVNKKDSHYMTLNIINLY